MALSNALLKHNLMCSTTILKPSRACISRSARVRATHSLRLLQQVKELDKNMFTKSGIMVGLGETREQVMQVMDDMRSASIDFITIGQYLQPSRKHAAIDRFVTREEFKSYETTAYSKGFLMVSSFAINTLVASCG